jgi:ABC-type glycerol-3-phosphate transport system substrate-binding protein
MKKMKWLCIIAVQLVMVQPVFPGAKLQSSAPIKIIYDETGAPDYHPYFMKAAAELKTATGITLEPDGYPSTDVYSAAVRSSLPASSAQDLFFWWPGAWTVELQKTGFLAPVTAIWDKYKDDFPKGIRDSFTIDGQVYTIPWSIEYWLVYYNKDVYSQLRIQPPKTWDEFISNCQKIRTAGKTPLFQTITDEWPAFITFEEIAASIDPNLYNDLCWGRKKFTDPAAVEIFTIWKDMIDKGYFTYPSVNYFNDAPRLFNDNQLAMIFGGTWFVQGNLLDKGVPESKIGWFFIKTRDGRNRAILEPSPILVAKNSKNLDAAMKVVDYWMSPEGNSFLAKQVGGFPVSSKADASYLSQMKQDILREANEGNFTMVTRFWENMPTQLMLQVNQKFAEFMNNPADPQRICADIQRLCDAYSW